MTTTSIYAISVCGAVGAAIGYFVASYRSRTQPPFVGQDAPDAADNRFRTEVQLQTVVESLHDLTTHMGDQVVQHTETVNEITKSFEASDQTESAIVLMAGSKLLQANHKLQSDLADAKSEIDRQRREINSCMQEAVTDQLTGIPNRRALDRELSRTLAHWRRDGHPFSIAVIDIDGFKRLNDSYGHMIGDQALKAFSRCLVTTFRQDDIVGRFGGEEFLAILPGTHLSEAIKVVEQSRISIAANKFAVSDFHLHLTASTGLTEVQNEDTELEILQRADAALYAAKASGRNRCFYQSAGESKPVPPIADASTPGEGLA